MEFRFYLRNLRMAPRKVRSVAAMVKGLPVLAAQNQLHFQTRRPTEPISKLLKSGIASADKNFNVKPENLYIQNIFVDGGPMLKRFRPRAHGRAGAIQKKTSHITLILASVSGVKILKPKKTKAPKEPEKTAGKGKAMEEAKVTREAPKVLGPKPQAQAGIGRKIFQRKAIG